MTTDEMIALLRFRRIDKHNGGVSGSAVAFMGTVADEIERLQLLAADYGGQLTAANAEMARLRDALQDIFDWYMADNEDRGGHALEVTGAVLGLSTVDRPAADVSPTTTEKTK